MVPCCEECITFALCRQKERIECKMLTEYCTKVFDERFRTKTLFQIINESLPKIKIVVGNEQQLTFQNSDRTGFAVRRAY
jgi:hypothetical protein